MDKLQCGLNFKITSLQSRLSPSPAPSPFTLTLPPSPKHPGPLPFTPTLISFSLFTPTLHRNQKLPFNSTSPPSVPFIPFHTHPTPFTPPSSPQALSLYPKSPPLILWTLLTLGIQSTSLLHCILLFPFTSVPTPSLPQSPTLPLFVSLSQEVVSWFSDIY